MTCQAVCDFVLSVLLSENAAIQQKIPADHQRVFRSKFVFNASLSIMDTTSQISRAFSKPNRTCGLLPLGVACLFVASFSMAKAVDAPVFLPIDATNATAISVAVNCPSAGATIHYTVSGAEPTIYDPVVASGSLISVKRNMTLKAKAWVNNDASTTTSSTFEVTGDLAAGALNLIALKSNGQVYGWGNQEFGRLATGVTTSTNLLAPGEAKKSSSVAISDAARLAGGANHTVLVDSSNNVWASGQNQFGESGNSLTTQEAYAVRVLKSLTAGDYLTGCVDVAAGLQFSGALTTSGHVYAWGDQASGRLGNGTGGTNPGGRKYAANVKTNASTDLSGIRGIEFGKDFALAREANAQELASAAGHVWAWGENGSAQLATGGTTDLTFATKVKLNSTTELTDAWDVSAGDAHSVIVRWKNGVSNLQGTVWTMGSKANGRLGNNPSNTNGTQAYPVQVVKGDGTPLTNIVQVSAGPAHTLALDTAGNVWAWGANSTGALGDNSTTERKYAVKVKNPTNTGDLAGIIRVMAGGMNGNPGFSAAVASDGTIYVWGSNQHGLLANNTTSTNAVKLPVALTSIKTLPGYPTISVTANITQSKAPGAGSLIASVDDPDGSNTIQKVDFYVQGALFVTKNSAPWSEALSNLAVGTYHVYAVATDVNGNETVSLPQVFNINPDLDSDNDGLPSAWEIQYGLDPNDNGSTNPNNGPSADPDGDHVTNFQEFIGGTNPNSIADANSDGLPDDWVTCYLADPAGVPASTLPPATDTDLDGLTNFQEFQLYTHPRKNDSDGDGFLDWGELARSKNPNDPLSKPDPISSSLPQGAVNSSIPIGFSNFGNLSGINARIIDGSLASPVGFDWKHSKQTIPGAPVYQWIEIKETGQLLTAISNNNTSVQWVNFGFNFPFFGQNYNGTYVASCGFLVFDRPGITESGFPESHRSALPNPNAHRPMISVYQDYLQMAAQGDVYFQSFADHIVVQYENIQVWEPTYYGGLNMTFQVVIYQDGRIFYNFKNSPLSGQGYYNSGYLSGVQNADGTRGVSVYPDAGGGGYYVHGKSPITFQFTPAPDIAWASTDALLNNGVAVTTTVHVTTLALPLGTAQARFQIVGPDGNTPILDEPLQIQVTGGATNGSDIMDGSPGADVLSGLAGNDTINGLEGDDILNGQDGNDFLNGHQGNDQLFGGAGNDVMTGGNGDDLLRGESGKDSYYYNIGDGNDSISDYAGIHEPDDLIADYSDLYFGEGIIPSMVRFGPLTSNSNSDLVLDVNAVQSGRIVISDWNYVSSNGKSTGDRWRFHFVDGTVWNGNLFWNGFTGYKGFTGGNNDDLLVGTASIGTETFRGLLGNDVMKGGAGWDDYIYRWGDGHDVIEEEYDNMDSELYFESAYIRQEHLSFEFVPPLHLRINVSNPSDTTKNGSVMIKNWYQTSSYTVKNEWKVFVGDSAGNYVEISSLLRNMITDGPDYFNLVGIHTTNGQTFNPGGGDDRIFGSSYAETIIGDAGNDVLYGYAGNDTLIGGLGGDFISGDVGDDVIEGGAGTDNLNGGDGNDTLVGNEDNDELLGGTGSDTYLWNLGDGNDLISDSTSETSVSIENRLVFGAGIAPSQVEMQPVPIQGLKFIVRDSSGVIVGSVIINDWYKSVSGVVRHAANWRIAFTGNATVWDGRVLPTPGNDLFAGGTGNDSFQGGAGVDTLQGLDGGDVLLGDGGNDTLEGGNGDDQLNGGEDDDDLKGGTGSDTYLWNIGDGHDTVTDVTSDPGTNIENKLVFGAGIEPSQIRLVFDSVLSLRFSVRDSSDAEIGSVKINNWYANIIGGGNHAKHWRVHFTSNSTIWDGNSLVTPGPDKLVGGSAEDQISGDLGDDSMQGLDGDDTLSGQEGNDALKGGNGNDTLYGGVGADTIDGETGNDELSGGSGNDYIIGGLGSDTYYWQVGDGDDTLEEPSGQGVSDLNVIKFSGEVAAGVIIDRIFVKVVISNYADAQFVIYTPEGAVLAALKVKNWDYTKSKWRVQFPGDAAPFDWQLLSMLGTSANDSITGGNYRDEIKGLDGNDTIRGLDGNDLIEGGSGGDTIYGGSGADAIEGGEQDDILFGDDGDDSLAGDGGNDSLYGGAGIDTLTGGAGDDLLQGGTGEDRYIWVPGDGHDTITEFVHATERNHLIFGQEVLPSDIQLIPVGQNLRCNVLSAGQVVGSVTLNNWYVVNHGRWLIEFGNGEIWNQDTLATSWNDVLTGGIGDDHLEGKEGNDSLSGGNGNDVLEGGIGDDSLTGASGSNQYIYRIADGNDHVYPNVNPVFVKDRLSLFDIARSAVSIETLNSSSPLEVKITILSNGQTILIHGGNFVLIEFSDATVEYNALGQDVRLHNSSLLAGWHDDDGDGFPNDVENALNAFNGSLADSQNAALAPVADAIVDTTITTPVGTRYPSLGAAVAAAHAGRAGKPYIVIRVEPGVYIEDVDLNVNGVFIQGPGSAGRATFLRKSRYTDPQIRGEKVIFNGLCFGDGSTPLEFVLHATDYVDGIRYTNCLFHDQSLVTQVFTPQPVKVTSGSISFVHCSFVKFAGMNVANANVKFVNSLVESVRGASWTGDQQILAYSTLLNINVPSGWQGFGVRSDGLLKVSYPGKTSMALDKVAQSDRLLNWRDLDGELRDAVSDIGCDEYIDSDNTGGGDQLADWWEIKWFGNLTAQSGNGDPDADSKNNLMEYDAETNPIDSIHISNPNVPIDLTSADSYGATNLLGDNPLPDVNSANWIYTADGDVTFSGRQGRLDYRVNVAEPVTAALFLNAKFQAIAGTGITLGAARIYLDDQLMKEINGSLTNVVIPLYLLSSGTHTIRIELINAQRGYRPVIDSVSVRALASSDATPEAIATSTNRIITLPSESLTSPAFVEGESMARGSISLSIPNQNADLEVQAGPHQMWFSNVPLEESPENTGIEISFGSGQLTEQHQIRWKPTILELVPSLTIRKGDALRLQAAAAGATAGSSVDYWIGSQQIGSAVLGTAYAHHFPTAGTYVLTAKIGGVAIEGAESTVTVVEASFGTSALAAACSVSSTIQLPLVPSSLVIEAATSLALSRNGSAITVRPTANGPQNLVARLGPGGPVVATGKINVFSLAGTGFNGGGRIITILPDGRKLTNMSYSIDGPIPSNLRVKITVSAGGCLFLNGTNVMWLTANDFDEFGVANVQVFTFGAICQSVQLFLAE